jgi:TIR domain/NB-ARC domain
VFVSYSHCDAEWVQRFTVLLRPLLRVKRLQLWVDTDIRGGERWHPVIMDAITRSAAALILVSGEFLDSDFIMDRELPALIEQGVRLAPVLVSSCLWRHVPELVGVQWLHDPDRDGALDLLTHHGERNRRLTAICERLIKLAPIATSEDAGAGQRIVAATPVAEVPRGAARGELFGVPALPPGYVARDELKALIETVVSTSSGAVGLTGQAPAVGLHGQGGIGKSVLAAVVARDEGVRSRFRDGLFWVTLGEAADPLAAQLDVWSGAVHHPGRGRTHRLRSHPASG